MKIPKRSLPRVEDGLIDEVIGQLMGGKEATVYLVRCGGEIRCAKHMRALYQEGELTTARLLTGLFPGDESAADLDGVMLEIKEVMGEEQRQQRLLEAARAEV